MSLLRTQQEFLEHYDELADYVRKNNEPVYITDAQGASSTVLLSVEAFEQLNRCAALEQLLSGAIPGGIDGEKHPEVDVLAELEKIE